MNQLRHYWKFIVRILENTFHHNATRMYYTSSPSAGFRLDLRSCLSNLPLASGSFVRQLRNSYLNLQNWILPCIEYRPDVDYPHIPNGKLLHLKHTCTKIITVTSYGRDSVCVSNHQPHDCFLNRLFRRRSKETPKLRVTGICAGNSPGTGESPQQMASYAENVTIWWRHHVRPNRSRLYY